MTHWTSFLPDFHQRHVSVDYYLYEIEQAQSEIQRLQTLIKNSEARLAYLIERDYTSDEIEKAKDLKRFKAYLVKKGWQNCKVQNICVGRIMITAELQADSRSKPNEVRKDFSLAREIGGNWYKIALFRSDFDNEGEPRTKSKFRTRRH